MAVQTAEQTKQDIVQAQQGNRQVHTKREVKVETKDPGELSGGMWFLLLLAAMFFDATGALCNFIPPPAGQIVEEMNDAFADGGFALASTMTGVKFSRGTMFATFILKFIPLLNILPEYTFMIIIMYYQEKGKKKLAKIPGGKIAAKVAFGDSKNVNNAK